MKTVHKPWGHEQWICDGTTTPYAFKRILFKAGNRTSLQVHRHKTETNYVLDGTGILVLSRQPLDLDEYLSSPWSLEKVAEYEQSCEYISLRAGTQFTIPPLWVHRVIALDDLHFMEVSTTQLDDVVRLQDDSGRQHGRISGEHS